MALGATVPGADLPDGSPQAVASSPERPSDGGYSDALIVEVGAALDTLRELMPHGELLGDEVTAGVESAAHDIEQRLERTELSVVVVGAAGSGKRTFLDALLGEPALGAALGNTRAIVVLRCRDGIDFRARLADSRLEQFSSEVPDRRAELDKATQAAAEALEQAQASAATLESNIERATTESRRAADAWGEALATFEGRRLDAVQLGADLEAAGLRVERVGRDLAEIDRHVPTSLRERFAWWALWLWLWRALFALLFASRWRRHTQGVQERDAALAAFASMKKRVDDNEQACRLLEAELEPLGATAEASRAEASDAEGARVRGSANLERARAALDNARAALDLHVQERRAQFVDRIEALARAGGGRQLRELEIDFPASLLPEDIALVDIPEVTGVAQGDSARVWSLVRERADACVLVSDLERPVGGATKRFLQRLREVVPHVFLVLTKMDRVFMEAARRRNPQPWAEVEKARRAGTLRFASEIERAPEEVFSLATAARAALEDGDSGLARRFKREVDKLFHLLHHERAIVVGSRATKAIQCAIAGLGAVREAALAKYGQRVEELETHRAPPPGAFKMDALAAAEPRIAEARSGALREASDTAHGAIEALRVNCRNTLSRARSRREVLDAARQTQTELDAGLPSAWAAAEKTLQSSIEQRVTTMEQELFAELRRRYRVLPDVRGSQSLIPRLEASDDSTTQAIVLGAVETAASRLGRVRLAASAVGAVTGAVAGRLIAPTLSGVLADARIDMAAGAIIGLSLGAFATIIRAATRLKRQAGMSLDTAIGEADRRIADRLHDAGGIVYQTIYDALDGSLDAVMKRFAEQIAGQLDAEANAIARAREAFASLQGLGPALGKHDDKLFEAMEAAVEASVAMCR